MFASVLLCVKPCGPKRDTLAAMAAPPETSGRPVRRAALAIVEVTLAFAAVHLAFRSFRHWTELGRMETRNGLNFSPGLTMIAVGAVLILVGRRSAREYGLKGERFGRQVWTGLGGLAFFLALGVLVWLAKLNYRAPDLTPLGGLALAAFGLGATILFLRLLQASSANAERRPSPSGTLAMAVFATIATLPTLVAAYADRPVAPAALMVLWVVLGSGLGEELFFRGYVQSRLNQVFGRPWKVCGVRFGFGLIGATLLFALIHVLNPVDYFGGTVRFAWGHGLATLGTPYGFLREKTGSIVAPVVMHSLLNIVARLVGPA